MGITMTYSMLELVKLMLNISITISPINLLLNTPPSNAVRRTAEMRQRKCRVRYGHIRSGTKSFDSLCRHPVVTL
jgi:hypothetical protein